MSKITVLIADDEPLAREAVRLRLESNYHFEVIAEADNGLDAYLLINHMNPDVVFMDINMPKLTGVEALEKTSSSLDFCLIFITASEDYALQAFRFNAIDYVTKPISDELFNSVLMKIKKRIDEKRAVSLLSKKFSATLHHDQYLKRLSVRQGDELILIETSSICFITSAKDYLCITTLDDTYIHRQTMQQIESLLDPKIFLRCHRSHIVNKKFTTKWVLRQNESFLVCNNESFPVSRRFKTNVKSALSSKIN